jgi:hypothetical protein
LAAARSYAIEQRLPAVRERLRDALRAFYVTESLSLSAWATLQDTVQWALTTIGEAGLAKVPFDQLSGSAWPNLQAQYQEHLAVVSASGLLS